MKEPAAPWRSDPQCSGQAFFLRAAFWGYWRTQSSAVWACSRLLKLVAPMLARFSSHSHSQPAHFQGFLRPGPSFSACPAAYRRASEAVSAVVAGVGWCELKGFWAFWRGVGMCLSFGQCLCNLISSMLMVHDLEQTRLCTSVFTAVLWNFAGLGSSSQNMFERLGTDLG